MRHPTKRVFLSNPTCGVHIAMRGLVSIVLFFSALSLFGDEMSSENVSAQTAPAESALEQSGSYPRFAFDVTAGFDHQILLGPGGEGGLGYVSPEYLAVRRPAEPELAAQWGLNGTDMTDNPLGHGASFYRFHTWLAPVEGLELYGSLTLDHRGFSWGAFNTDDFAVVPIYHLSFDTDVDLPGEDGGIGFYVGTFENFRNYEGLTLYNLDLQGISGTLRYGVFSVAATAFGDLVRGVGLNTDGVNDFQARFLGLAMADGWTADLKTGFQRLIGFNGAPDTGIVAVSAAAQHKSDLRLYSELGYRNTGYSPDLNWGVLAGVQANLDAGAFYLAPRLEYRYYGGGFNSGLRNDAMTHYRSTDPWRSAGSNFIGEQVYPLEFYGRPFSQWAVFTEYDGLWVQGLSLSSANRWYPAPFFALFADVDLNAIFAEGLEPFLYAFVNAGVRFEIEERNFLTLSVGNKTMNLDKHYTTYYQSEKPILQIEVRRTL